jgi:hypothetical protein
VIGQTEKIAGSGSVTHWASGAPKAGVYTGPMAKRIGMVILVIFVGIPISGYLLILLVRGSSLTYKGESPPRSPIVKLTTISPGR